MQISQRTTRLLATGLAAAAVAGVMVATAALTGKNEPAVAGGPGSAPVQQATASPQTAKAGAVPQKKAPKATKYVFQNERPAVGTLPVDGEVRIADHLSFATRRTQWAVISRVPGEPEYEPFGWRKTIGNDNIGDGTSPGIQSVGPVVNSVFKSDRAATVVYTSGTKAWYAKVYKLAGIPGWVESSATIDGGAARVTPGPRGTSTSVFVYDANNNLLTKFGDAKGNPLAQ